MHLVDPNVTSLGVAAASTSSIAAQSAMDPDEPATTTIGSGGFGFSSQTTSPFGQPTQPSVFGESSHRATVLWLKHDDDGVWADKCLWKAGIRFIGLARSSEVRYDGIWLWCG